jgi:hypothetical protein
MANDEDEYAIQYLSRDEAVAIARGQATRDLTFRAASRCRPQKVIRCIA